MEKSPTRKGPTTPDRQAARPLILDCVLYSASAIDLMCATTRSLARPRLTHTGSPARPSGRRVPLFLLPGGSCVYNRRFTVVSFNPPPSHHAVKAIRASVYGRMGLSPPDLTPRPDRRRYRRPTGCRYAQPAAAPGPTPGSWAAANPQTKWKRKTLCSN